MVNTFFTSALSQEPLPAIRSMWNWYPLIRMLRMSKVPIAGQPSLSANAIGTSPSPFIFSASVTRSLSVVGGV